MSVENTIFVLCAPEDSRNIGACCRAMKTMQLYTLRIVGEKNTYDENQVHTLALDAFDVWQNALFFKNIRDAVADCTLAAGTTRRFGKRRKGNLLTPQEFSAHTALLSGAKIAVVFGNERTGLTREELDCCTLGITIPSNAQFGSLNLSHAVQVIAWELFKQEYVPTKKTHYASIDCIEKTVDCLITTLTDMGFFTLEGKRDMAQFWKTIFSRAAVSSEEVVYLEKVFFKMRVLSAKKNNCVSIDSV